MYGGWGEARFCDQQALGIRLKVLNLPHFIKLSMKITPQQDTKMPNFLISYII